MKGDVFTEDAVRTWIDYKRENEHRAMAIRPHPHEFELYFDC
jgi:glutamine synthetase